MSTLVWIFSVNRLDVLCHLRRLSVILLLGLLSLPVSADVDEQLRPETAPAVFRDHLLSGSPCSYCPDLVRLPLGRFLMGAFPWEGHDDERGPDGPFSVELTQPLSIAIFETSRDQYAAFVAQNPDAEAVQSCAGVVEGEFRAAIRGGWRSPGFEQGGEEPAVCVSWEAAQGYVRWLSAQTGAHYRLPTEAEWEYAAKAGSLTRYWWGDRIDRQRANCRDQRCDQQYLYTAPPLAMGPNRFGLYHILGNVWEWTADCYRADAYHNRTHRYPAAVTGEPGCKRVIRGGSWAEGVWSLRSSNREGWLPDRPLNDLGFRVVREGKKMAL